MNQAHANFVPLSASLRESASKLSAKDKGKTPTIKNLSNNISYRIFSFQNINDISKAASMVSSIYKDDNSLYKSPIDNLYYLIIHNKKGDAENYQKTCNLLSEYGTKSNGNYAMPYYFSEHFTLIIKDDAIQTLASI